MCCVHCIQTIVRTSPCDLNLNSNRTTAVQRMLSSTTNLFLSFSHNGVHVTTVGARILNSGLPHHARCTYVADWSIQSVVRTHDIFKHTDTWRCEMRWRAFSRWSWRTTASVWRHVRRAVHISGSGRIEDRH